MKPKQIHATLVAYLEMKIALADWHGVQDAASDLRDLEAAHPKTRDKRKNLYARTS